MSEKPVGIAMLGLGRWSRHLARAVGRVKSLKLVTGFTRTVETRRQFAAEFDCEAAATLEAALTHPGVEAAIIAAPSHAHPELTQACAEHGLHVFVEKPMANSLAEARHMALACREKGLVLMVGHEMRRLGSSRAMKAALQAGRLGRVVSAVAIQTLAGTFQPDNWRCHRDSNRGGALMQLGIHQIETLQYLLGPVISVQGFFAHLSAPADVDDTASAHLTFAGGTLATITASYVSPLAYALLFFGDLANLSCVVDMRVWPDALQVDPRTQLNLQTNQSIEPLPIIPQDVLALQADEFARSVRGLAQPETGADQGLAALAVVEAALLSFERGTSVDPRSL
jgi:UDP-N-acetyl-2-amino-2-deoxyglucuronate dehydrogenase